jgi:hypothetical protein
MHFGPNRRLQCRPGSKEYFATHHPAASRVVDNSIQAKLQQVNCAVANPQGEMRVSLNAIKLAFVCVIEQLLFHHGADLPPLRWRTVAQVRAAGFALDNEVGRGSRSVITAADWSVESRAPTNAW